MRGIHLWPVNSPHKGPVTREMFPFYDVIMISEITHGDTMTLGRFEHNWLFMWTMDSTSQRTSAAGFYRISSLSDEKLNQISFQWFETLIECHCDTLCHFLFCYDVYECVPPRSDYWKHLHYFDYLTGCLGIRRLLQRQTENDKSG